MSNDGTMLGNVSGGGGVLEKTFSTAFSVFSFFFLLSLSPFPSLILSPSPPLYRTLSSSLSFSLSCGFLP